MEPCDTCATPTSVDDRWVVRVPRPSDPSDWTAVLWLCEGCALGEGDEGDSPHSPHQEAWWDEWVESADARARGALWLT
jgi:hypothetical protein